jgi:hypothetical protein
MRIVVKAAAVLAVLACAPGLRALGAAAPVPRAAEATSRPAQPWDSPAYDLATAHAPRFADRALWPHFTGKEAYAKQKWPAGRLLVWSGGNGKLKDASKWLEGGKPASRGPDRNTDLVFPPAAKPYKVKGVGVECRHITIGRGAGVAGGYRSLNPWGNCWVKEGGQITRVDIVGDKCTFFRMDFRRERVPPPSYAKRQAFPFGIHDKMLVAKYREASVELLGTMGVGDEIFVVAGRMVIGPDSEFRFNGQTGNGTIEVHDGATLELQSGAVLANHYKSGGPYDVSIHVGATLRAGSPQRPITRDAFIRADPLPAGKERGVFCAKGGAVRVHSADPKRARLVFESIAPGRRLKGMGIEVHLAGEARLNGVVFDQVRRGGIKLADLSSRRQWRNVFFGPHNAAAEEALFSVAKKTSLDPRTVKLRLYVNRGLKAMKKFEEEE